MDNTEGGWFVSTGEYSSYRVECIFDKQEDADNWTKLYGGRVESVVKNPKTPKAPEGMTRFAIKLYTTIGPFNGQTIAAQRNPEFDDSGLNPLKTILFEYKSRWFWVVYLWAKDEQHAMKIANEIRSRLLTGNCDRSRAVNEWTFYLD